MQVILLDSGCGWWRFSSWFIAASEGSNRAVLEARTSGLPACSSAAALCSQNWASRALGSSPSPWARSPAASSACHRCCAAAGAWAPACQEAQCEATEGKETLCSREGGGAGPGAHLPSPCLHLPAVAWWPSGAGPGQTACSSSRAAPRTLRLRGLRRLLWTRNRRAPCWIAPSFECGGLRCAMGARSWRLAEPTDWLPCKYTSTGAVDS